MPPQAKDRRRKATKTRQRKKLCTQYQTYQDDKDKSLPNGKLQVAFSCLERGHCSISGKSTLAEKWTTFKQSQFDDMKQKRNVLLSPEEERSVIAYCLWQSDRGMNATTNVVKAIIRSIHSRAVASPVHLQNSCIIFLSITLQSAPTGRLKELTGDV